MKGKIALIGNPNSGKSSLFNLLTGLQQKTGNFPGVTVERVSGQIRLADGAAISVTDFPGTYSLYPTSLDEQVVFDVLSNPNHPDYPDLVIYVADAVRLDQHLLLMAQVRDLGIRMMLTLTMEDEARKAGVTYDLSALEKALELPVVGVNGRSGEGLFALRMAITDFFASDRSRGIQPVGFSPSPEMWSTVRGIRSAFPDIGTDFRALLYAHHADRLTHLSPEEASRVKDIARSNGFDSLRAQYTEIMDRFREIDRIVATCRLPVANPSGKSLTRTIDRVATHAWAGPMVFFALLFLVFQVVFTWSALPMAWIELLFTEMGGWVVYALGSGWISSLLSDGILAGLGGVLVFIPQIALLFLLIAILEESGYMARAVYLFDRLLQRFGMNGRSLVALVSGTACAIPAIMSARTITNRRERLITILVTPFISCSARLPVYAVLVGLIVPSGFFGGWISYQALAFMGLYLLGTVAAFSAAFVFRRFMRQSEPGYLLIELPEYQMPHWRNVLLTVWSKVRSFVREAGSIIIVISVVLWFLASYGPPGNMDRAAQAAATEAVNLGLDESAVQGAESAARLEASFAGILGKGLEPIIAPLGFDWKIGIALVTSFAAREVFVGTMATIYSIGGSDDEQTIRARMAQELNPATGKPRYSIPVSLSLLLFYVFAMQCMSTVAVVRKETGGWKWPLVQLAFMTGIAYLGSLTVYQALTAWGI